MDTGLLITIAVIAAAVVICALFFARTFVKSASTRTKFERVQPSFDIDVEKRFASDDIDRLIGDIKNQADKKKSSQ